MTKQQKQNQVLVLLRRGEVKYLFSNSSWKRNFSYEILPLKICDKHFIQDFPVKPHNFLLGMIEIFNWEEERLSEKIVSF